MSRGNLLVFGTVIEMSNDNVKKFKIEFPEVPPGIMRELRKELRLIGARTRRNAMGGISVFPLRAAENAAVEISEIALSIGDLDLGLAVDAATIPVINTA